MYAIRSYYEVARFYTLLANGKLLSPPLNALMKETLSNPGILV